MFFRNNERRNYFLFCYECCYNEYHARLNKIAVAIKFEVLLGYIPN